MLQQAGASILRKWVSCQCLPAAWQRAYSSSATSGLDSIMKLESLQDKQPDVIAQLWQEFHDQSQADIVGGIIQASDYDHFATRAAASPRFVLPLGKPGGGYLTFFLQAQMPHVLLTFLEEYKTKGPAAEAQMTLTHFTELQRSKNLVLVRGSIHDRSVSKSEARTLMELTRAFYLDPLAYVDVHNFNDDQAKFNFDQILKQLRLKSSEALA